MPKNGKQLFKVRMKRGGPAATRLTLHTQARSKEQAERFATHRKPGFSVVRVRTV